MQKLQCLTMLQKYYLFGRNIKKAFSPFIHKACFKELGLDTSHCYEILESENLEGYNQVLKEKDFCGASVFAPYKKCFDFLPKLGISNKLGNINTIVKQQGLLVTYNTDYAGIANCLEKYTKIKTALVIGAGSTAQTFCQYLAKRGIQIYIVTRRSERLQQIPEDIEHVNKLPLGWLSNPTHQPDIIINVVPQTAAININPQLYRKKPIIMDINYRPRVTDFIQNALDNDCKEIIFGIDLLIAQGLEQNYIFTGKRVNQQKVKQILKHEYEQQEASRCSQFE